MKGLAVCLAMGFIGIGPVRAGEKCDAGDAKIPPAINAILMPALADSLGQLSVNRGRLRAASCGHQRCAVRFLGSGHRHAQTKTPASTRRH